MDFLVRIASLVRKELLAVLRDKKSRLALIIPPIIQIAIFGYAATMNVTRVPYAVLDKDGGEAASQYIADLEGTGIFQRQATAATEKDIDRMIDNREIVVGLTIPPDFSRNIQTGRPASLQLIADGRNTNTAAIALSYGQQIASAYGAALLSQNGVSSPVEIESRAWFNPNLITRWFPASLPCSCSSTPSSPELSPSPANGRKAPSTSFSSPRTPPEKSCSVKGQPPSSPESYRPSS